jgi:hypothetical protein
MKQQAMILGSVVGALGAAVTTIAAALCCVGPIVVTLLGVSGAVAVARLEPYTLQLFAGSAAMLSLGFYMSYGRGCQSADGSCPSSQRNIRKLLWGATLLTVSTFVLNRLGILAG